MLAVSSGMPASEKGCRDDEYAMLRHNKGLDRFTLRGRKKVETQWKLYCMVHNIEKLAHHGYGQQENGEGGTARQARGRTGIGAR